MLKKKKWNETQLEELLLQMPKIEDKRNPQTIFQNISSKIEKRKRFTWVVPTFASALALLLFFILVPGMFTTKDLSTESNHLENDAQQEIFEHNPVEEETAKEHPEQTTDDGQQTLKDNHQEVHDDFSTETLSAVYEQDLQKYDQITFAIPDDQVQNIVPITVLVEKDDSTSWFEKYENVAKKLPQSVWGLAEYFPLDGKLTYDEASETIQVDLPANSIYSYGSAGYTAFIRTLQETFSSDEKKVKKVVFTTEGQKGFEGHGDYLEELAIEKTKNRGYFLFTPKESGKTFLVPSTATYENIENAFQEMKKTITTHMLTPTIPDDVTFERIEKENNILHVHFTSGQQISDDYTAAVNFVEAILLTAKDFGYRAVKFETTNVEQIGPFELKNPIKVPLAANKSFVTP